MPTVQSKAAPKTIPKKMARPLPEKRDTPLRRDRMLMRSGGFSRSSGTTVLRRRGVGVCWETRRMSSLKHRAFQPNEWSPEIPLLGRSLFFPAPDQSVGRMIDFAGLAKAALLQNAGGCVALRKRVRADGPHPRVRFRVCDQRLADAPAFAWLRLGRRASLQQRKALTATGEGRQHSGHVQTHFEMDPADRGAAGHRSRDLSHQSHLVSTLEPESVLRKGLRAGPLRRTGAAVGDRIGGTLRDHRP